MDEGASQMIECPGSCKIVVNDKTVMALITDPRVKLKYQHLITNSFVQCNRSLDTLQHVKLCLYFTFCVTCCFVGVLVQTAAMQ